LTFGLSSSEEEEALTTKSETFALREEEEEEEEVEIFDFKAFALPLTEEENRIACLHDANIILFVYFFLSRAYRSDVNSTDDKKQTPGRRRRADAILSQR
jgi:hypothetical protein